MKNLLAVYLIFFTIPCLAQDMVSSYKPKTKKEKLVIAKLKSLQEIKELYSMKAKHKRDIVIGPPESTFKFYRFQVGTDFGDRFATSYWLEIDPKTLRVYYDDFDAEGVQTITLQQWRYWRNKPEFNKIHAWKNGKLVVLKDQN